MIRFFVGLIVTMGAMGGMDNPENSLIACVAVACVGLALMALGVEKMKTVSC